jgi:hypothetical protein
MGGSRRKLKRDKPKVKVGGVKKDKTRKAQLPAELLAQHPDIERKLHKKCGRAPGGRCRGRCFSLPPAALAADRRRSLPQHAGPWLPPLPFVPQPCARLLSGPAADARMPPPPPLAAATQPPSRARHRADWDEGRSVVTNYGRNGLLLDPNQGFGRNQAPEPLVSLEARTAAGEETFEDDDELRALNGLERKTGRAAPPRLTGHQTAIIAKLLEAHGDDTAVRARPRGRPLAPPRPAALPAAAAPAPAARSDFAMPRCDPHGAWDLCCRHPLARRPFSQRLPSPSQSSTHARTRQAMVLDRKLNKMQHSEGKLKLLITAHRHWAGFEGNARHDFRAPFKPYKRL